jgi:hypothetical protein
MLAKAAKAAAVLSQFVVVTAALMVVMSQYLVAWVRHSAVEELMYELLMESQVELFLFRQVQREVAAPGVSKLLVATQLLLAVRVRSQSKQECPQQHQEPMSL